MYAAEVVADFHHQHTDIKYTFGPALYVGWVSSVRSYYELRYTSYINLTQSFSTGCLNIIGSNSNSLRQKRQTIFFFYRRSKNRVYLIYIGY